MEERDSFLQSISQSIANNTFIKIHLGNYKGENKELQKIIIKKVILKDKARLSFNYKFKTKDETKNFEIQEGSNKIIEELVANSFRHGMLYTLNEDVTVAVSKSDKWFLKKMKPSQNKLGDESHDKKKERRIQPKQKKYLQDLKITDAQGNVKSSGQDKFKQINHYIEILSSLLSKLDNEKQINIVDMGSGKGYLTFALYDYLTNELSLQVKITGVEFRNDLVDLCNSIARKSEFKNLQFIEGTIQDFNPNENIDILIALHACDTATDDAIHKGILAQSDLIVVAPCCHKQIRKEMKNGQANESIQEITKHGILLERQAEMLTDTLRALYLEQAGYKTKIFDFIATQHTPKNIIIVGEKRKLPTADYMKISDKIEKLKKHFGVQKHFLGSLLNLNES